MTSIVFVPAQRAGDVVMRLGIAALTRSELPHRPTLMDTCGAPPPSSTAFDPVPDGAADFHRAHGDGGAARRLRRTDAGLRLQAALAARRLRAAIAACRGYLTENDVRAVVVNDDRRLGPTLAMSVAARAAGLPLVVLPFAHEDPAGPALLRGKWTQFQTSHPVLARTKRRIVERHPEQVYRQGEEGYLYYSPLMTLALEGADALPERPWTVGASLATHAACFDEVAVARVTERTAHGVRATAVGDLSLDDVFAAARRRDEVRAELFAESGLPAGKPLVVFALPQFSEQGTMPWERHRAEMERTLEVFAALDCAPLVSLHPKSEPGRYRTLVESIGGHVARRPLREYLPACDLFTATHSSTVAWAVATDTPAMILDFDWLNPPADRVQPHVPVLTSPHAFRERLGAWLTDDGARAALLAEQSRARVPGAPTDGRAGERFASLLAGAVSGDGSAAGIAPQRG